MAGKKTVVLFESRESCEICEFVLITFMKMSIKNIFSSQIKNKSHNSHDSQNKQKSILIDEVRR